MVVEVWRLRQTLEKVIGELRGVGLCRVRIDSMERTADGFKVSGRYVCREFVLFEGERVVEEGGFEVVLDREYGLVSVKLAPVRSVERRGIGLG